MFERYDKKARRVIFFARYQAAQDRDSHIRCAHILSGIERVDAEFLREAGITSERVAELCASEELVRRGSHPALAPAEFHLDEQAKNALIWASGVADMLRAVFVQPVHVFWGIFRADPKLKVKLAEAGVTESRIAEVCRKLSDTERQRGVARSSRSGIGYDLHRLAPGRKLVVGGLEIPFDKGPVGHSDGDVLSHAICDALLGAAGLGDIGTHFPDTDPKWRGVSSLVFLEQVSGMFAERGLSITHIDAVVIAEKPKLAPHFSAMREALAKALAIDPEQINLKAKTNEGVDAVGCGEAIAAQAIATLES